MILHGMFDYPESRHERQEPLVRTVRGTSAVALEIYERVGNKGDLAIERACEQANIHPAEYKEFLKRSEGNS